MLPFEKAAGVRGAGRKKIKIRIKRNSKARGIKCGKVKNDNGININ